MEEKEDRDRKEKGQLGRENEGKNELRLEEKEEKDRKEMRIERTVQEKHFCRGMELDLPNMKEKGSVFVEDIKRSIKKLYYYA